MTKFLRYTILLCVLICTLTACRDDKEEKFKHSDSVRITAFSLSADTTILDNLNTVFFTIDLEKGLIYNADSLPKGTDVSKLAINISTDSASEVTISTLDTTYNYLDHNKKKIDLTFPIHAKVVSRSKLYSKDYQIKVNVHTMESDRLTWGGVQYSSLPGEGSLQEQRTIQYNGLIHCYMQRNDTYYRATAVRPGDEWDITTLDLSFTPQLQSLRAGHNALYLLDNDGILHTSTDGITWNSTNQKYAAIIGCLDEQLLTLTHDGSNYYHDIYPRPEGYTPQPTAQGFPVSGHSDMLTYDSPWLTIPQGMIIGGRTADGSLTGAMWGYDGSNWARLNNTLPAREGATFFPYVTFFVDDNWITTEMPTWFVIGGINETTALRDIWISNNYGVTWKEAGDEMILPGYILPRGFASVIICDEPINSPIPSWESIDMLPIPQNYRRIPMYSTKDNTLVPYIYMFGGKSHDGINYNQVWRGIINRLRFEPIP